MDLTTVMANLPALWHGVWLTVDILIAAIFFGLISASCLTVVSFSGVMLKRIVDAYIFIIRGTPMLVQFYFIYYGLPQLAVLHTPWIWPVIASPITCSVLALTISTSAYTTVILRGAFLGVPAGEIQAANALGLTRIQIFRNITLPRSFSLILPLYSNEVLMLLKSTSLASTITVLELTGTTELLIGETYQTILYWLIAGAIYLVLSGVIIGVFKLLERRFAVCRS